MKLKGSSTIEMAYIMPIIFFILLSIFHIIFYYHDKSILNGVVCEAVTVGVKEVRNKGKETIELEKFCIDRITGKMIYFSNPKFSTVYSKDRVEVKATMKRGPLKVFIKRETKVPYPEKSIRLKETMEGIVGKGEEE